MDKEIVMQASCLHVRMVASVDDLTAVQNDPKTVFKTDYPFINMIHSGPVPEITPAS